MKIVAWIRNEANEKALVNKIHKVFPISAIIMETRKGKRKLTVPGVFEFGIEKLFLNNTRTAWWRMLQHYHREYPNYPDVPILDVPNVNSEETFEMTKKEEPDLIIVSGTRLIKQRLLSLSPSIGIINLHTGLSPYVKGGPNCTNWCIAKRQFHLIGNSVMWLDAGIDTGNLIYTERTVFDGSESLFDAQLKVMEHGHRMYLDVIKYLHAGGRNSVPQSELGLGKTYFNKEWRLKNKIRLSKNLKKFREFNRNSGSRPEVATITLNSTV